MKPRITKRNIDFILHNPGIALRFLTGRSSYERILQERVGKDLEFIRRQALVVGANSGLLRLPLGEIDTMLRTIAPASTQGSWRLLNKWHAFLYAVTRAAKPVTVIETGVLYGHSSASVLAGLEDNAEGRLISVDLPAEQHQSVICGGKFIQAGLTNGKFAVGCAVPLSLRSRWNLQLGNSLELLPKILNETGPISMFIHDSLHTYDHMMSEFELGYSALEPGGLLISDDIGYNSAWQGFCKSKGEDWKVLSKELETDNQFGFLIKSSK